MRSPASTEACIHEVVETSAAAIARHLGDDAAATLRVTDRRQLFHDARFGSDPEVATERLPVMTVSELARASARIELETPSSLSAFEVPAPQLWARRAVHEQLTRKVPPPTGDEPPRFGSAAAPWLFAAMALVVGLATSGAIFMRANVEETRSPAAAPPPAADHVPPTPIVAPARPSATTVPAASASGAVIRRRRF